MQENSETQTIDLKKRMFSIKNLLSLLIIAIVVYIFVTRFDLTKVFGIIGDANPLLYILGAIFFYSSLPLRGFRWGVLLREKEIDLPTGYLSRLYFLSWFVNSILPARIGDFYRAYLLKKNNQIRISLSLGVLLSEKVFDLASIALMVVLGGIIYINRIAESEIADALMWALIAVLVLVIGFSLLAWKSRWFKKILPSKLHDLFDSFNRGIFRSPGLIPSISIQSLLIWLSESFRLYFVILALGYDFNFLLVLFVSQAALIVMSLPLTPAGLGLVELLIVAVLIPAGLSQEAAAAVAIVDRLISYWSLIAVGGLHFLMSGKIR